MNNVENYYYSPLNEHGQRNDMDDRKELLYGSVDFLASSDYMNRPPMAPTYVFVLDVSKNAIESGYLSIVTSVISRAITDETFPGGERTKVALITYDDRIHFYNLKSTLRQPQVIINTEHTMDFLPVPEDLLVNLQDSKHLVLDLLERLPEMFEDSDVYDSDISQAIKSIGQIAKPTGAKVFLFDASPNSNKFPALKIVDKPGASERNELL